MQSTVMEPSVRVKERRMTERIRQKWSQLAAVRLPTLPEVEQLNLGLDREYTFAIDLRLSDIFPYFIYMGERLAGYSVLYPAGDPRREKTLLDAAMMKMDEAALTRKPVDYSAVARLDDGRRVAFRSILLPVSENGRDVSHIFGAAKGKSL